MNGSEAPTISSVTPTLTVKPTANTFSCGTTFETMPKAMSVTMIARMIGAAISIAPTNSDENAASAEYDQRLDLG